MKNLFMIATLLFTLAAVPAFGQGVDDQYVRIYNLMQQADTLNAAGNTKEALPKYLEAQAALQRLQRIFPDWKTKVVNFRLGYLATKIESISGQATPQAVAEETETKPQVTPAPPSAPPNFESRLSSLENEVRALQADKTILESKLKEALATQPAVIDPRQLTKAQEKVQLLMKENDLLKASLEQERLAPIEGADPRMLEQTRQALAEANRKLAGQTERADTLAAEKLALQDRLKTSSQANADIEAARQALAEANRKLAEQVELSGKLTKENEALQARVSALMTSADAADALRAENALLKKQVADLSSAVVSGTDSSTARELAEAQARIAALQSDSEILRLEKIALQNRVRQMAAAPMATPIVATGLPVPAQSEDGERIKKLEQERDDLRKALDSANQDLFGRKGREVAARVDDLSGQIDILRSRLQIFEARAVPYSAEELMLFEKSSSPVNVDPNSGKAGFSELPEGTKRLVVQAQRHFAAREFAQAEEKYLEVLRKDEKNPTTLANLAAIQLELNRLDEAEKHIKRALAIAPEDGYSLSLLGYLKFRQENYDEALDALSRAAKLDPDNPEIQNYLGVTLGHKGLRGPAETALRRAIQLDPKYGAAHNNLAVIYVSQQPPLVELARWHYQKAIAAGHPHNGDLEKMLDRKSASAR